MIALRTVYCNCQYTVSSHSPTAGTLSLVSVLFSRFSHVRLFVTLWTVARQAPLARGFSRREYSSGLPFPLLGYLHNTGIERTSPTWQADTGICSFKHGTGIQYTINKCLT